MSEEQLFIILAHEDRQGHQHIAAYKSLELAKQARKESVSDYLIEDIYSLDLSNLETDVVSWFGEDN